MGLALKKETISPKTIVVGLGETGLSVARYLAKQGVDFKMLDTRSNPPQLKAFTKEFPNTEVQLGELSISQFEAAEQIIVSPGIDIHQPEIRRAVLEYNCECIGDIELFARHCKQTIVAITGSNGKSTVTSLLAEMAKTAGVNAYAGGNLAPPALDLLVHDDAELFVLECSSFQLESTQSLKPNVSVVLNVSDDHLDRHGDMDNYASIKASIYRNADNSVINREDQHVIKMETHGRVISFGLGQPETGEFGVIEKNGTPYLAFEQELLLSVDELTLQGEAGVLNSLAALAIGQALALPMERMLKVLKSFKGLPHRMALVSISEGVTWYNDSKGTNIGATVSSLRSLEDNVILILGGVFKGGDLELLARAVTDHAKQVILMGKDAELFVDILKNTTVERASSMQHAVEIAKRVSQDGDKVLLSPACASFDMYPNYISRGNDFENCVKGSVA